MRKINFGSGPAALPQEVLQEAAASIIEYNNSGLSILEIPHRGKAFEAILEESNALVKELCELPDDEYEVLWLQGGRLQFSMIPSNFLAENATAAYLDSGHWSAEAIENAQLYGNVTVLASSKNTNYNCLPALPDNITDPYAYLYLTTNNTIYGTQWKKFPKANAPLVADMSSDILSCKRAYHHFDFFYAVAQKNIGPTGVTLVVLRKDFLKKTVRKNAPMLDYQLQAKHNSVFNTPPVFAIYTSLLMLRWMKKTGMETIFKNNAQKAATLYQEIDRNSLFNGTVTNKEDRSTMNVCFTAINPKIATEFLNLCNEHQIEGVKGHRSVGGFRVSLYNAITQAAVEKLVSLMREFEQQQQNQ